MKNLKKKLYIAFGFLTVALAIIGDKNIKK